MAITRYNLEAKPDELKKPLAEFHTLSTWGVEGVDDFEFSETWHLVVGGWTKPFEKYAQVKWDHFPKLRGWEFVKKPPPPRKSLI